MSSSSRRLLTLSSCVAGGTWVAWGMQNREVPLRKSAPLRWELRSIDGTANMYLALTAVLAAGLSGVEQGLEMHIKDCPSTHNLISQ